MTCVEANIRNWNVKHLSLWGELVTPEVCGGGGGGTSVVSAIDVEEAEEATTIAMFQEMKTKISPFSSMNFELFKPFLSKPHFVSQISHPCLQPSTPHSTTDSACTKEGRGSLGSISTRLGEEGRSGAHLEGATREESEHHWYREPHCKIQ